MTEIYCMFQKHAFWKKTIALAENCSWKAGPLLTRKMKSNNFKPWERVFTACVDGKVAGFCTPAEKDELQPQYPFSPLHRLCFCG